MLCLPLPTMLSSGRTCPSFRPSDRMRVSRSCDCSFSSVNYADGVSAVAI